ncbi:hypothetical protein SAMN06273570_2459 [Candidatus Pantoea floridensis]|uniref:Uncharacterized protein n=1 Tax=Candidatus Pantoea floridensis TaxID=1938870 RepID=A0A286BV93_9GAMM|nr:hypothetical protein BX596_4826 [Enterobacteriaceae bacterium JKS000233]SOD38073.1 hypothetical protein SAMN06273570_2459 [Pantoea floridensis]
MSIGGAIQKNNDGRFISQAGFPMNLPEKYIHQHVLIISTPDTVKSPSNRYQSFKSVARRVLS